VRHAFNAYPPPNTNVHWFGLPFTAKYAKASDLVGDVEGSPTGHSFLDEVGRWDPTNQVLLRYRWTPAGWTGPDFAVAPGDGLYFIVRLGFTWTPRLITPEVA